MSNPQFAGFLSKIRLWRLEYPLIAICRHTYCSSSRSPLARSIFDVSIEYHQSDPTSAVYLPIDLGGQLRIPDCRNPITTKIGRFFYRTLDIVMKSDWDPCKWRRIRSHQRKRANAVSVCAPSLSRVLTLMSCCSKNVTILATPLYLLSDR